MEPPKNDDSFASILADYNEKEEGEDMPPPGLNSGRPRNESDADLPPMLLQVSQRSAAPTLRDSILDLKKSLSPSRRLHASTDPDCNTLSPTTERYRTLVKHYGIKDAEGVAEAEEVKESEKVDVFEDLSTKGFPGIAVKFDATKYPHFGLIVVEVLSRLKSLPTGQRLLKEIGDARPTFRSDFPEGINVIVTTQPRVGAPPGMKVCLNCLPSGDYEYQAVPTPEFLKQEKKKSSERMASPQQTLVQRGSSENQPQDVKASTTPGEGSVCKVRFTNTQVTVVGDNSYIPPEIVFGHEFVHALHCAYGASLSGNGVSDVIEGVQVYEEEQFTVGIGRHAATPHPTENKLRREIGMPDRITYQ